MPDPLNRPQWRAGVNRVLGSGFTPYSPALTASTTSPTGWDCQGRWFQVGPLVVVKFLLTAGTSMTAGSGTYRIGLPVPANVSGTDGCLAGAVWLQDSSTGNGWQAGAWLATATYAQVIYGAGGSGAAVTNAAPWAWAAGDDIDGTFMYEAAAL